MNRPVSFRSDGRILIIALIEQLAEIGFYNISWKDFSQELDCFAAEKPFR